MLKHIILAASAALLAAPAFAQAPDVELEGVILSWNGPTRTLDVMGTQVYVPDTANVHSPVTSRADTGLKPNVWFKGLRFPGRTQAGFMQGTAIVTGTWDAANNRVIADDVAVEPAENVSLGVITASFCSNVSCDGPGDYIRGNSNLAGGPGAAFLPIRDIRMLAAPVGDEGGFDMDLTGVNMNGMGYVAEGYYGTSAVPAGSPTGTITERAFHYFSFGMAAPTPELLLNKDIREISVIRADCRVGKDFEIRGFVHSKVNPDGTLNDTIRPNNGVAEVVYNLPNGTLVRQNATAVPLAANSPEGRYRIRFNPPTGFCPASVAVRWVATANQTNPVTYATKTGAAVEIRDDGPGD